MAAAAHHPGRSAVTIELAFLGHTLERLARALDAVLIVIAIGREQFDDAVGAIGRHLADGAGREVERLPDLELVLLRRYSLGLQHTITLVARCAPSISVHNGAL